MRHILLAGLLLAACGGESGEEQPVRLVRPGVLLAGPAGGTERVGFADGSSLNFNVSGRMAVTLPRGVYLEAAFPAAVSFTVVASTGEKLAGTAVFERVRLDARRRFTGETTTAHGASTFTGALLSVSDATHLQVESFAYDLGAAKTVYLQSDGLAENQLAPQP